MHKIKACDLSVAIQKTPILHKISFELASDQILCILGQNGSGKSTLLRTLLGLLAYKGSLKIGDQECKDLSIKQKAQMLSYVPQTQHLSFPFKLFEVVLMGRFHQSKLLYYSKQDKKIALETLEKLELSHLAMQNFNSLSGGQKQLGFIARALCQDTKIMILDEPVSALDLSYSFKLLKLLRSFQNKSIILSSHHPEQCFIADHILMLKQGKVFAYGESKKILNEDTINALYEIKTKEVELPNKAKYFCPLV
ncbi:hypothetical protein DMB92_00475 [Campylobacter sp. MIT 99-7217]|uniref:ABC transporter ATP-binding protein n=1 Tax=Campylobacter sp. MIT 99-7217 TaxID=535091 RepID=UPI00115A6E46|nr:ABC transporter ATP-binding protein [Campylobacter sp. MIT 99-7217]TQR34474.1 hypothetical protein DMB92_00475 [Campylobacter sp. MIT 99-7217]